MIEDLGYDLSWVKQALETNTWCPKCNAHVASALDDRFVVCSQCKRVRKKIVDFKKS